MFVKQPDGVSKLVDDHARATVVSDVHGLHAPRHAERGVASAGIRRSREAYAIAARGSEHEAHRGPLHPVPGCRYDPGIVEHRRQRVDANHAVRPARAEPGHTRTAEIDFIRWENDVALE